MFLQDYYALGVLFAATVDFAFCQCGGSPLSLTANTSVQYFTSPGYDTNYPSDLTCEWLIDSGVPGQRVIVYSDYYDMDCAFGDTISIYDGSTDSSSPLAAGLCGTSVTSNTYVSSDQYVLVKFSSDGSNSGKGFEMVYVSAAGTVNSACSSQVTFVATETPQYFTSNNFPDPYDSDSSCRWIIRAVTTPSVIHVDILWRDIEVFTGCRYDKMSLFADSAVCERLFLTDVCSKRNGIADPPLHFNSTTGNFLVHLTSDDSQQGNGFIIKYYATIPTTTQLTPGMLTSTKMTTLDKITTTSNTFQTVPDACLSLLSCMDWKSFILGGVSTCYISIFLAILVFCCRLLKNSHRNKTRDSGVPKTGQ